MTLPSFPQLLIDELEALKVGVESSESRLSVEEIVAKINGLITAVKLVDAPLSVVDRHVVDPSQEARSQEDAERFSSDGDRAAAPAAAGESGSVAVAESTVVEDDEDVDVVGTGARSR